MEPNQTLNKGITHTTINPHNVSETDINKAKKDLLTPLIKDETILNIMSTDENFNKITHKLDYNVIIKDEKGETIVTGNKQGIAIRQAIEQIKKSAKPGQHTKASQGDYTYEALQAHRWHPNYQKEGIINKIELRVNMRQG